MNYESFIQYSLFYISYSISGDGEVTVSEGVREVGTSVGEGVGVVEGIDSVSVTSGVVASVESVTMGLEVGLGDEIVELDPEVVGSSFATWSAIQLNVTSVSNGEISLIENPYAVTFSRKYLSTDPSGVRLMTGLDS